MENFSAENEKSENKIPLENLIEPIEKKIVKAGETERKIYDCDINVDMSKEKKQFDPEKIFLVAEKICADNDEVWNIVSDSDSDCDTIEDCFKIISSSHELRESFSTKLKTERSTIICDKKIPICSSVSLDPCPINREKLKQEIKKERDFPLEEKKCVFYSKNTPIENSINEVSPCSDRLKKSLPNIFEKEKKLLTAGRKSSNSIYDPSKFYSNLKEIAEKEIFKHRIIEQEIIKQKLKRGSNVLPQKKKHRRNSKKLNCKKLKNKFDQNSVCFEQLLSRLEDETKYCCEKYFENLNDHASSSLDETSLDCSSPPDSQSHWTHVPPSSNCSTYLPNSTCSTSLSGSSISSEYLLNSLSSVLSTDYGESNSMLTFYDKVFLNDLSSLQEMLEENIEVSPLEECTLIKELSKPIDLNGCDVDLKTENTEKFVEDPDIVNPDILYNIDLNEYYMQIELLVQKISEKPEDQSVFAECMQLPPMPKNKHGSRIFTSEERYNFANGISEYEYDIDTDDWNKIMVKRAVVFTAHAGFTIANEESLYVLADVAIDYIKKLAVIMKNNFDIQENSSYPDCIDPIDNSLLQIGVQGGIEELIKHYDNDVYGRRDKLIKKCQHLKKIIDQYTERMRTISTKTQNSSQDNSIRENLTSEKVTVKEDIKPKEEKVEMEPIIDEVQPDFLSSIEEVEIETQSSLVDNVFANFKVEPTDPIHIDLTDCDVEVETNENIKSEAVDNCDFKIEQEETMDLKTIDVDISKHLDVNPDCTALKDMCVKEFTSLNSTEQVNNSESPLLKCSDSSDSIKKKKELPIDTVKKWLKDFYPSQIELESIPDPVEESWVMKKKLQKHMKEFNDFMSTSSAYNNSVSTPVSTDSDGPLTLRKQTLPKIIIVNQKSDKNEADSLNKNKAIQNSSTSVAVNKNDNYDYKMSCHYISLNSTSSNN